MDVRRTREGDLERDELADLVALLPPLLGSLDGLAYIGRHLNPPEFASVMNAAGAPDAALRDARSKLQAWPDRLEGVSGALISAIDCALIAFEALRAAPQEPEGMRAIYRGLGQLPRAQEALYPLAADIQPISRFFLEPAARNDADLQRRLTEAPAREDVGVMHVGEPGARGAFSAYAPEYYTPDRTWPLVVALHGGAGNGRTFLWSWLRDARTQGAILISPTAIGETWALSGPDRDTPNLMRMLDWARSRWRIDPERILLTGMSDGGTFSVVSGLEPTSPFTHLAPVSTGMQPFLVQMADEERLAGLPIYLAHGALDWMFPVQRARDVADALAAAGASVVWREFEDLSHTYPREVNREILQWLDVARGPSKG
jgi:phospholipase/carboxylesterase